jgi:hypothetical protein
MYRHGGDFQILKKGGKTEWRNAPHARAMAHLDTPAVPAKALVRFSSTIPTKVRN